MQILYLTVTKLLNSCSLGVEEYHFNFVQNEKQLNLYRNHRLTYSKNIYKDSAHNQAEP